MKLIDAVKNKKGFPFNVPNCGRDELPGFFKEQGFKVGAEIGVYRGEYTEKFCKAGLTMYAIDPWAGYVGAGRSERKQDMQDTNYEFAKKRLSKYKDCTLIRKTSMKALEDIKNGSLDFIYIDGDHRFPFIAEDLYEWYWKVKKGGVIAGHDYFCTDPWATNVLCQVGVVVDAFVKAYKIENFYTFGRTKPTLEEEAKNDRTLSWMFYRVW